MVNAALLLSALPLGFALPLDGSHATTRYHSIPLDHLDEENVGATAQLAEEDRHEAGIATQDVRQ